MKTHCNSTIKTKNCYKLVGHLHGKLYLQSYLVIKNFHGIISLNLKNKNIKNCIIFVVSTELNRKKLKSFLDLNFFEWQIVIMIKLSSSKKYKIEFILLAVSIFLILSQLIFNFFRCSLVQTFFSSFAVSIFFWTLSEAHYYLIEREWCTVYIRGIFYHSSTYFYISNFSHFIKEARTHISLPVIEEHITVCYVNTFFACKIVFLL